MSESKEITVVERAALALGADEGEKTLVALSKKYTDIVEIKNPAGRTQCHAAAMELSNARINVDKTGKAAREDANAFQKAVIAEVARRVAIIKPEEERLLALRDAYDAEREAERQAKAAAEAARITFIRKRIGEIQAIPSESVGRSAADLAATIELTEGLSITLEEFGEFAGECEMVKVAAVTKLGEMLTAQVAHEAEQARIAAEREALAKERAEAAERERIAEAERQAQAKRDREALAARQAELAEQERKAAAARAEQEAKDRTERERVEAEQRAAQERAAAAMRAEREAHEAAMAKQRAELAAQQAEIDRAKAEQERITRESREAAETAARAEAERIAAEQAAAAQAEADRIFAEQQRIEAERRAAEMEQIRREQIQFELNGPGEADIVRVLAEHFDVNQQVALSWIINFDLGSPDLVEKAA